MSNPGHNASFPRRRGRRGFSLIELLAVVAIILILLALLVPLLGQIKEQGRNVSCMSKLRQLGVAFQTFMADHNGVIPGCYANTTGAEPWQKEYMGREVLDPGEVVNASWPSPGVAEGTLVPYLGVAKPLLRQFYRCPSMVEGVKHAPWTGSNGRFDYSCFKIFAGSRISLIPNKAQLYTSRYTYPTPLLVEEDPYFYLNNGNIDPGHSNVDRTGSWHLAGSRSLFQGGSGNYMAIDGSAHTIRPADLPNRSGSVNGDTLLLLGPYANDWSALTPSGARMSIGNTSINFGQWNSL
ncbi:MAG: prepilin-type N-terminal cleavage/methylation domain-containing protein [Kiritimatiellia bacterium]